MLDLNCFRYLTYGIAEVLFPRNSIKYELSFIKIPRKRSILLAMKSHIWNDG